MPLKQYKTENDSRLTIHRALYAQSYSLTVDRTRCVGCDICKVVCPREAIELRPVPRGIGEKAIAPKVDVDVEKCDYDGICEVMCPFGAISVKTANDKEIPVIEKDCFPQLIRDIEIDDANCSPGCKICEEKCPLKVVTVKCEPSSVSGNVVKASDSSSAPQRNFVQVNKNLCSCCKRCEAECPPKVIHVEKFFNGTLDINQDKCPEGCHECLDVCPVNALSLSANKKVQADDAFCVYCRACVNVCPIEGAINVTRTSVCHTPVKSGTWNRTLEKLTSTTGIKKELRAKGTAKAIDRLKILYENAGE